MAIMKYGPPLVESYQIMYGPPSSFQTKYGPYSSQPSNILYSIISLITTPIFIIVSFIIGSILFLITHKKIFIIIPLILSFFYLLRYLIETFFGFSLS